MAVLPKIVYNFNENSASTIRDYSENGNDGTGTNLTIASSSGVGYDAVFNSTTDQIDMGNITDLNGVADCAIHFKYTVKGGTGIIVVGKSGQLVISYNHTSDIISFSLTVASGTAKVTSGVLSVDTEYDMDMVWDSDVLTLYIDGVSVATDATESGVVATSSNTMYIGDTGVGNSANFLLNEFKLYDVAITTTIIDAVIAEPNGISSDNGLDNDFAVGDVIVADYSVSAKYGIVTYADTSEWRFLPITDSISGGMRFQRVGNLFDTTRQDAFLIDNTPKICFYDGVSKSSEVFTEGKQLYCLGLDGIINGSLIVNGDWHNGYYKIESSEEVTVENNKQMSNFNNLENKGVLIIKGELILK
jgi:hypothetical protein|tara:strand:- start:3691 stop:4770 length:1080 start_codon:yes stop_codon:yes gene_type:complete